LFSTRKPVTTCLIFTGLLICVENTFWDINGLGDSNFVERFKKSFTLYVESGMREMTERDIEIFRNEQGEISAKAEDFNAKFCKFIFDHYLSHLDFQPDSQVTGREG